MRHGRITTGQELYTSERTERLTDEELAEDVENVVELGCCDLYHKHHGNTWSKRHPHMLVRVEPRPDSLDTDGSPQTDTPFGPLRCLRWSDRRSCRGVQEGQAASLDPQPPNLRLPLPSYTSPSTYRALFVDMHRDPRLMALSPRHHLLVRVLHRVLLRAEEKHVLQETAFMTHHRKRQELSEDSCIQQGSDLNSRRMSMPGCESAYCARPGASGGS